MPDESIIIPIEIVEQEALKSLKSLDTATSTVVAKMQRAFNLKIESNAPEELKKSEAAFIKMEAIVNATVANINKKLESISGSSNFKFTANSSDVNKVIAEINILQKELKDLQTASIEPKISTTQLASFNEQIENTKTKIDALRASSGIVIAVDTLQLNKAIGITDILEADLLALKKLVVDPAIDPQQLLALNTIIASTETKLAELKSFAGIVITADGSQVIKTVNQIRDELGKTKINTPLVVSIKSNVPQVLKESETSVRTLGSAMADATARINANIDKMAADALRLPDAYKRAETSVKSFGINAGNALSFLNKQTNQFAPGRGLDQFIAKGKQVEQALGRLAPSSNQATFALTNFGLIAQDLPFGIIGIANNITPLVESLQRLSVQAKETGTSVGTQLLSALKGGGGLILGVSILTSALQFAALGMSAFSRMSGGAGAAAEDFSAKMKKVGDVIAESTGGVQGDIAEINSLVKAFGDTSSFKEQAKILTELKGINESYFGEMKAGVTTYDQLTKAANAYTDALVNQAIIDGLKSAISDLSKEYGTLLIKYNDQTKAANDSRIALDKTKAANATVVQGMTAQNAEVNLATNSFNNLTAKLSTTGTELGKVGTRIQQFKDQIQTAVALQLKFKPLEKGKDDLKDETDAIIARAKLFVKEFGDVFVLPDLEETFFHGKKEVLKEAVKLLDDISKKNLKIKLPHIEFSALEGEIPFEPKVDPNFKFDEDGSIRKAFLAAVNKEFDEPVVIDPTINVAVFNEKIKTQLDKALKSGDFKGALDLIDTNKSNAVFDGLSEEVKTSAGLINDTLTPAFQGLFDAITKGENPLKAFFNSIIQSVNQVIQRLIAAAIQAAILSAISGGGTSFGSAFGKLFGGGGGAANFGQRVGFAGGGGGSMSVNVNGVLRGTDIYLSGVGGGRSIGRAGG